MLPWRRQAVIRKLLGCEHPRCIPSLSFSPLLPLDIFFFLVGFVYWQGLSSRPRPKFSVSSWRPGTSRKISECVIEIRGHAIMIFRKFARFPSYIITWWRKKNEQFSPKGDLKGKCSGFLAVLAAESLELGLNNHSNKTLFVKKVCICGIFTQINQKRSHTPLLPLLPDISIRPQRREREKFRKAKRREFKREWGGRTWKDRFFFH